MRRNCNLELCLNTSGANSGFPLRNHHDRRAVLESSSGTPRQQQQPLTIFYDGMMCVSDVTKLQARSILFLANKEMEERFKTSPSPSPSPCASTSEPSSPSLQSPICSPSMKKSLQTFLQKRKYRIQATSHPYNH
ncbi:protein TIFY 5A-like [Rosa rugosa]|uniref:protein TIFY 5A-like n=1 Tax=Rosa rugosa TaxID=74645 RepID=UPI002B408A42|nr:protein TIFY 5A-like [Rosa rugosa]